MITLDDISKKYPGSARPAVQNLNLEVEKGETLVLLGPSGCGKTTTLEMINRLVTPTSGNIFINGRNTSTLKTTELRREIGYVIQDAGLFPHRTVAQNIATVPQLLKWQSERIEERVDELLEMVHLAPDEYRNRMPSELSGGQRQRVGVARALAADPDVILMDEPFGALDPITRGHLQSEFLRLQDEIHKTIVFVTHDIDEALRMGDRIAVFGPDSTIEQLDTPMRLITAPASPYVENFVGGDTTMRVLGLMEVRADEQSPSSAEIETVESGTPTNEIRIAGSEVRDILVTDDRGRPQRWVLADALDDLSGTVSDLPGSVPVEIEAGSSMREAAGALLSMPGENPRAVIVDEDGRVIGALTLADVQRAIAESGVPPSEQVGERV
ncbi:ATP-binding cassette domain-containing protein [uncultured Agrococcus sp.]|uniref:ATP-binding cassette domain-containing protein n=1 Tax=uncultured Agrococcus sp. TaxID=382258 RepID=UPI0025FD548A|nr:ATP-binding cassette domain-containing protein [uncultured Agrococcus sp.]